MHRANLTKIYIFETFENFSKTIQKLFKKQFFFWRKIFLEPKFLWRRRSGLGPGGPKTCLFPVFGACGFLPGGILCGSGFWPTGCKPGARRLLSRPQDGHKFLRKKIWRSVFSYITMHTRELGRKQPMSKLFWQNQLLTRSGWLCGDKSVFVFLYSWEAFELSRKPAAPPPPPLLKPKFPYLKNKCVL